MTSQYDYDKCDIINKGLRAVPAATPGRRHAERGALCSTIL